MKQDNRRLVGGAAIAVVLAAAGGFGLAKCTTKPATPPIVAAKSTDDKAAEPAIEMTPAAIRGAGILVQPVAAGGLAMEILSQGAVVAAPGGEAVLTARASGSITRLFKRLGDSVRKGETLAVVESRDAAQYAADRATAGAKATLAQRNLAREKSLYEQRVSPRVDYERAEAEAAVANAEARRAQISAGAANVTADGRGVVVVSPINGRITASQASLGAFVQPENELFRVADPRLIQIEASVGSQEAPRIAVGDRAVIEASDGQAIEARVRSITPTLNAETRAATAVIEVTSTALQPGQAVRVRILPSHAAPASSGFVLPEEAVQSVGGHDVVFLRTSKGFQIRPVTVGQRSAGRVEVTGVSNGQSVAVKNAFLLKAEVGKSGGED